MKSNHVSVVKNGVDVGFTAARAKASDRATSSRRGWLYPSAPRAKEADMSRNTLPSMSTSEVPRLRASSTTIAR